MSDYLSDIQFENNSNILLQNTLNIFLEQLILLNRKMDQLEGKIETINNKKNFYINTEFNKNEIDWNSIHLY